MSMGLNKRVLFVMLVLACCVGAATVAGKQRPAKSGATATKPSPATMSTAVATHPAAPRVANIRITGQILETPASFSLFGDSGKNKTLREWIGRLAKARQDDQVAAVALEFDGASLKWSQAQELADAVRRLREVKPVYAYTASSVVAGYTPLSCATELAMEPSGELDIVGLAAELMYYRGTLDLLGIEPQMIQIGKYKGASEPMALTQPSKEFKDDFDNVLDDLYNQLISQIAANRKLTVQQVKDAVDEGPFDAQSAKKFGLVDVLIQRSKWEDRVGKAIAGKDGKYAWVSNYGQEPKKTLDLSNPFSLLTSLMKNPGTENIQSPGIAIISAEGVIVSGLGGEGLLGGTTVGDRTMAKALNEAAANDLIKAVVIRIDSPGGSALASEMIYQAIRNCAAKKPVIASISGMGASGGYYIALGATTIYADSTALVGSIGVISGKYAMEGLFKKVGISTYSFTRGKNSGLELSRPWTPRELETMRKLAQNVYDQFTSRVTESRGKRIDKIEDVAQGRIFTARQAAGNGLIDKIGGLKEAVDAARKAAGITGGPIITLPKTKTLSDLLMGDADADESSGLDEEAKLLLKFTRQSESAAYFLNIFRQFQTQKVLLALPYYVQIKG